MYSWECVKCGYVYSYMVRGCENCNRPKFNYPSSITGDANVNCYQNYPNLKLEKENEVKV